MGLPWKYSLRLPVSLLCPRLLRDPCYHVGLFTYLWADIAYSCRSDYAALDPTMPPVTPASDLDPRSPGELLIQYGTHKRFIRAVYRYVVCPPRAGKSIFSRRRNGPFTTTYPSNLYSDQQCGLSGRFWCHARRCTAGVVVRPGHRILISYSYRRSGHVAPPTVAKAPGE